MFESQSPSGVPSLSLSTTPGHASWSSQANFTGTSPAAGFGIVSDCTVTEDFVMSYVLVTPFHWLSLKKASVPYCWAPAAPVSKFCITAPVALRFQIFRCTFSKAPVARIPSAEPPALNTLSTSVAPALCTITTGQVNSPPQCVVLVQAPVPVVETWLLAKYKRRTSGLSPVQ